MDDAGLDMVAELLGEEPEQALGPVYYEQYSPARKERYRIVRKIGEGAFGEVHEAVDLHRGVRVACKRVGVPGGRNGPELPKGVVREIYALRALRHPFG